MAQTQMKSEGKCCFCGKTYAKASMSKHLATHLKDLETKSAKISYHVKVEAGPYFLHLFIDGEKKLDDLDVFLRHIWLECCGHMSGFTGAGREEIEMSKKIKSIFKNTDKLTHEYDYGSTTTLKVSVLSDYPVETKEGIKLLSRNEPLEIMCAICKKEPANYLCGTHLYEGNALFCKKCAKKHEKECSDFADYAAMPVVNSPRCGVCAYSGGNIDRERDGIYKLSVS
jgi:hypothetical protein